MRLTKNLRIFLSCLVAISVGVVFLGQSPVWAKNILSSVLTGVGGGFALDKMSKKSNPKTGTIAAMIDEKAYTGGAISKIVQSNKGLSKVLIGSFATEMLDDDSKVISKSMKWGIIPGLIDKYLKGKNSASPKLSGSNIPRPVSAPGKIVGTKLK